MNTIDKTSGALDVSAVVCTLNSGESIQACLESLRANHVQEIVVVDGGSHDSTLEIAHALADQVLRDEGIGLGAARNIGIVSSKCSYVLNAGSDNVFPVGSIHQMVSFLQQSGATGISALTRIEGASYLERCLDTYRRSRFKPGPASVIGTPSLFHGDTLRTSLFDVKRAHSDDSELCERLGNSGSHFAISPVEVLEVGKSSLREISQRCRNYGISDYEVFRAGKKSGWRAKRQIQSLLHPLRVDFALPLRNMSFKERVLTTPFLIHICFLRYFSWASTATRHTLFRTANSEINLK